MKKETVIMILESLDANYRQRMSKKEMALQIRSWSTILSEISDKQGMTGLRKALEDPGEFMPPMGKFKEMCLTGMGASSLKDEGHAAWALAMSTLNIYSSPVFKDTAIPETIRKMGGWRKLCSMLTEDEPHRKIEFLAIYQMMRRTKQEFNPMLQGVCNMMVEGELRPDYRFIGYSEDDDKQKALRQITEKRASDKKILAMITGGRKR